MHHGRQLLASDALVPSKGLMVGLPAAIDPSVEPGACSREGNLQCASTHRLKTSEAWQREQWRVRPRFEDWPDRMDVYEAAAYLRSSYHTIRRLCVRDRTGRAALPHQRVGTSYRFRRSDLERVGAVVGRSDLS